MQSSDVALDAPVCLAAKDWPKFYFHHRASPLHGRISYKNSRAFIIAICEQLKDGTTLWSNAAVMSSHGTDSDKLWSANITVSHTLSKPETTVCYKLQTELQKFFPLKCSGKCGSLQQTLVTTNHTGLSLFLTSVL